MYKQNRMQETSIKRNEGREGETIETKIERIVNNNEPIKDGAKITFTERKDGVKPEFNIRTDRFEIALEAMDKVSKTHIAKRDERMKPKEKDEKENNETNKKIVGDEPAHSTNKQIKEQIYKINKKSTCVLYIIKQSTCAFKEKARKRNN